MKITCSTTCSTSSCLKNKPHPLSAISERRGPVPQARSVRSPSNRVEELQPAAQQHQRQAAAASRRRPKVEGAFRTWTLQFTSLSSSPVLAVTCPRGALWSLFAARTLRTVCCSCRHHERSRRCLGR